MAVHKINIDEIPDKGINRVYMSGGFHTLPRPRGVRRAELRAPLFRGAEGRQDIARRAPLRARGLRPEGPRKAAPERQGVPSEAQRRDPHRAQRKTSAHPGRRRAVRISLHRAERGELQQEEGRLELRAADAEASASPRSRLWAGTMSSKLGVPDVVQSPPTRPARRGRTRRHRTLIRHGGEPLAGALEGSRRAHSFRGSRHRRSSRRTRRPRRPPKRSCPRARRGGRCTRTRRGPPEARERRRASAAVSAERAARARDGRVLDSPTVVEPCAAVLSWSKPFRGEEYRVSCEVTRSCVRGVRERPVAQRRSTGYRVLAARPSSRGVERPSRAGPGRSRRRRDGARAVDRRTARARRPGYRSAPNSGSRLETLA